MDLNDSLYTFGNFKQSGSRYIAVTTFPMARTNTGTSPARGQFYENNLRLPPFNFPPPLATCQNYWHGKEYWVDGKPTAIGVDKTCVQCSVLALYDLSTLQDFPYPTRMASANGFKIPPPGMTAA
jgi:hypothetical protein